MTNNLHNYFQLHIVVFLSSIIPVIFLLIDVPALEIVFFRTILAALVLGVVLYINKFEYQFPRSIKAKILVTGMLTALYWVLLIISAKVSNASVSLIGIASSSIWVSLIRPVLERKKLSKLEILIGLMAFAGIWVITRSGFEHVMGLMIGLLAGFFGALLTVLNAQMGKKHNYYVITFYQMIGAWVGTTLFLPVYLNFLSSSGSFVLPSSWSDWLLIVILALVFSVYLYAQLIRLMKTISPFSVSLIANLSPIYGIITAILIFGESELMGINFYIGTAIILSAVVAHPVLHKISSKNTSNAEKGDDPDENKEITS